ncbi:hypothetical protein XNW1_2230004 [Xenorhabdus nematophila str. Websteri]|nr:hypothetical protein XNW1_150004 [Xenorhabdus nematophila str. Websteri]CEF30087.1 hypothetical protein XNW1_2230004 [Xenorhabdus nematophila str. Websteri]
MNIVILSLKKRPESLLPQFHRVDGLRVEDRTLE